MNLSASDLKPFCYTGDDRPYLKQPWSRGDFTYASNGHVLVRVLRLTDVPENAATPDCEKLLAKTPECSDFAPFPEFDISDAPKVPCDICDGRGTEHDCPDCGHDCEECDGTGEIEEIQSVTLFGAIYDTRYIKQIMTLPGLKFSASPPKHVAARFIFEGGEGLIMPRRSPTENHLGSFP